MKNVSILLVLLVFACTTTTHQIKPTSTFYHNKGRRLDKKGLDYQTLLNHYQTCLKDYPKDAICKMEYDKYEKLINAPRCLKPKIKEIKFHVALIEKREGWKKISIDWKTLYYNPRPALTSKNIDFIILITPDKKDQPPYFRGQFDEKGKEVFFKLTSNLAKRNGYLLIKRGDSIVGLPKVKMGINSKEFVLMSHKELKMDDFCLE